MTVTKKHYFGTDGIRGKANIFPLTPDMMMRVALAVAQVLPRHHQSSKVIIGKDTRLSGYMIEHALTAGFVASGMEVIQVGPMPTPAVAMLTRSMRADIGIMISASHNPYDDNGIKIFDSNGYKLSDIMEAKIESYIDAAQQPTHPIIGKSIGRVKRLEASVGRYVEYVKSSFPSHLSLEGLTLVLDCAHGAAYHIGPTIFEELGAHVIPLSIAPNGININDACGSQHPQNLINAVHKHHADLGIALDGDADRVLLVDEKGSIINGDQVMGLIAVSLQKRNKLQTPEIVGTVMCNMALEAWLKEHNITLHRTPVGDRYVIEAMRERHCQIGGEPSGHIILSDFTTTGDALIAALQVLTEIITQGKPASEVCHVFEPYPHILRNIPITPELVDFTQKQSSIDDISNIFGSEGRICIRKSGTEPLLRIMAEGKDHQKVAHVVDELEALLTS